MITFSKNTLVSKENASRYLKNCGKVKIFANGKFLKSAALLNVNIKYTVQTYNLHT